MVLHHEIASSGLNNPGIGHIQLSEAESLEAYAYILYCKEIARRLIKKLKEVGGLFVHGIYN